MKTIASVIVTTAAAAFLLGCDRYPEQAKDLRDAKAHEQAQARSLRDAKAQNLENANTEARDRVKLISRDWESGGVLEFVVTNGSRWSVKDVELRCFCWSASKTLLGIDDEVVYENLPKFSSRSWKVWFSLPRQTASIGVEVAGFTVNDPLAHLSEPDRNAIIDNARAAKEAQIAARKSAAAEKLAKVRDAELNHHQALADQGDRYGLYRLGKRYLDGDGVELDAVKGREFLTIAAAAGSPEAKALLASSGSK